MVHENRSTRVDSFGMRPIAVVEAEMAAEREEEAARQAQADRDAWYDQNS